MSNLAEPALAPPPEAPSAVPPRVRQWRMVIGLGRMSLLVGAVLGLWTLAMPSIFGARRSELHAFPLAMAVFVPGLVVAAVWPRRWHMLADESLRAASRRRFLLEQGAAMATELAASAASIGAAVFAAAMVLETRDRWASPLWPALPIVAAGHVLIFGMIVWVLRYRSGWLAVVPALLVTFVGGVILAIASAAAARRGDGGDVAGVSAALTAGGLVIAADAYRRWLATEFD